MKRVILLFCSLLAFSGLSGQQLIGTAGNFYPSSAGSVSWSLGEMTVLPISGANGQLTQGFQQSDAMIMNVSVEAGSSVDLCKTKEVALDQLGASIDPPSFTATWSTSGNGTFDDTNSQTGLFNVATLYQPSAQDMANGGVTLTLTADIDGTEDTVEILIIKVDCGSFPWDGGE